MSRAVPRIVIDLSSSTVLDTRHRHGLSSLVKDEDLHAANRQALEQFPASHPNRSITLNNLAAALLTRFTHAGQHEDMEAVISLHQEALELRPAPYPARPTSLTNLAVALSTRFE
jgi:hypothetical protein